jgi:hypothetical protein
MSQCRRPTWLNASASQRLSTSRSFNILSPMFRRLAGQRHDRADLLRRRERCRLPCSRLIRQPRRDRCSNWGGQPPGAPVAYCLRPRLEPASDLADPGPTRRERDHLDAFSKLAWCLVRAAQSPQALLFLARQGDGAADSRGMLRVRRIGAARKCLPCHIQPAVDARQGQLRGPTVTILPRLWETVLTASPLPPIGGGTAGGLDQLSGPVTSSACYITGGAACNRGASRLETAPGSGARA